MSKTPTQIRIGESFAFTFDLDGGDTSDYVCTLIVKQYPSDTALISRVIPPLNSQQWEGFITSTESAAFTAGIQLRLIGSLVNATTDEQKQIVLSFSTAAAWN